jgi:hypothetical protein
MLYFRNIIKEFDFCSDFNGVYYLSYSPQLQQSVGCKNFTISANNGPPLLSSAGTGTSISGKIPAGTGAG